MNALKMFKKLFLILLALAVLGVAAIFFVVRSIDLNDYKEEISAKLSDALNRTVQINGTIAWSYLPTLGVSINNILVENPKGFSETPLLDVADMNARVEILPLILEKRITIPDLQLNGVALELHRKSDGSENWTGLGHSRPTKRANDPDSSASEQPSTPNGAQLQIDKLSLTNTTLVWHDEPAGHRYKIQSLNLDVKDFAQGKSTRIHAEFDLRRGKPSVFTAKNKLDATVDLQGSRFEVKPLNWESIVDAEKLPQKQLVLNISGALTGDLEKEVASIVTTMRGGGMDATLNANLASLNTTPKLNGTLAVKQYNPTELIATISAFSPLVLDLESARNFNVFAEFTGLLKDLIDGESKIDATLGPTWVKADLGMKKGALTYTISSNTLDLDRLLPDPTNTKQPIARDTDAGSSAHSRAGGSRTSSQNPLPLKHSGTIRAENVIYQKMRVSKFAADLSGNSSNFDVTQFSGNFYSGTLNGHTKLAFQDAGIGMRGQLRFEGVDVEALNKARTGSSILSGKAAGRVDFKGNAERLESLKEAVQGTATLSLDEGAIRGIDISHTLSSAKSLAEGKPVNGSGKGYTALKTLRASASFDDRLINNDSLSGQTNNFDVSGAGKVFLSEKRVDYRLQVQGIHPETGQKRGTVPIAVRITGPWDKPTVAPDLEAYAEALAKREIEKKKDKIADKIEKKLEDALGGKLFR